ncbi:hypothetical protein FS749_012174, partial [Ceratobasidium sp. UAMH 11750]
MFPTRTPALGATDIGGNSQSGENQSRIDTPTGRQEGYSPGYYYPSAYQDSSLSSWKRPIRLELSQTRHRHLGWGTLLPTLAVFILTTGLGFAVLAWLLVKRRISLAEAFRGGYLLVDEGTKKWDGTVESATLRALTATSFISTVIAATSPVLMSLIAYHIAYLWVMEQQDNHSRQDTGPTPLQYSLMLQVLSASSIISLHDATRYLYKGKRRPRVPYYFTTAVVMGIVVYV